MQEKTLEKKRKQYYFLVCCPPKKCSVTWPLISRGWRWPWVLSINFEQKFFWNTGKKFVNSLGKFSENPKIVKFLECKPLSWKFWKFSEGSQMEQKSPLRNFWKFRYPSKSNLLFWKLQKHYWMQTKIFDTDLKVLCFVNQVHVVSI